LFVAELALQLRLAKTSQFVSVKQIQMGSTWSTCHWKSDLTSWKSSMVNGARWLSHWRSWHLIHRASELWEWKTAWLAVNRQNLLVHISV